MRNGFRRKIGLQVATAACAMLLFSSVLNAQDNFREFDRKYVATPAELHEALSTLLPVTKKTRPVDPQRLKEIEKAGRELLSELSPEQQEKVWEFAEKYLRKNGVDTAASQKLMQEFGLPPEMQSDLLKKFRKLGDRRSGSGASPDESTGDEISELLRKARENFDRANPKTAKDGKARSARKTDDRIGGEKASKTAKQSVTSDPSGSSQRPPEKSPGPESNRRPDRKTEANGGVGEKPKPAKADNARERNQNADPQTPFGQPQPGVDQSSNDNRQNRSARANRNSTNRSGVEKSGVKRNGSASNPSGSDAEMDSLLNRLKGLKEKKGQRSASGQGRDTPAPNGSDASWEKFIKDLAEKDIGRDKSGRTEGATAGSNGNRQDSRASSEDAAGNKPDQGMLDRAKSLFSNAFNDKKEAGKSEIAAGQNNESTGKDEKVGTRFDRLLVKAVDRTLESKNDEGVSGGVGGILGNLIERFQDRVAEKEEERTRSESNRFAQSRSRGGNRNRSSREDDSDRGSIFGNSDNESNRSSASGSRSSSSPSSSEPTSPRAELPAISDMIPDLSAIDPRYVFAFFGVVGTVLFVGYLLAQSFAGGETVLQKRRVAKRIRNTSMRSPKDLVETVDMFLLAKFGLGSSWWNAALAQRILRSGSPKLQAQVEELFGYYVRARYMRDDIEIPTQEQNRCRETLEALSKLDIKPNAKPEMVRKRQPVSTPLPVEG